MTLLDYYHRNVPEYYPSMYLDGYTPEQIMYAHRRKVARGVEERNVEIKLIQGKIFVANVVKG